MSLQILRLKPLFWFNAYNLSTKCCLIDSNRRFLNISLQFTFLCCKGGIALSLAWIPQLFEIQNSYSQRFLDYPIKFLFVPLHIQIIIVLILILLLQYLKTTNSKMLLCFPSSSKTPWYMFSQFLYQERNWRSGVVLDIFT